jgi:cellulose synthase/poly-beta-1,6-N-acetylglucosamine synthase-like glycosyltransferase
MKNRQVQISLGIAAVILLAAIARVSDSIPNFAPIGALALFSGAVIRDRRWSFILPLGAIFLSDVFFETTLGKGQGFYPGMVYNYVAYFLTVLLGFGLRNKISVIKVGALSIAGSLVFLLVSNFGVWASGSLHYPYTWTGLMTSYEMALPFFRNTLTSDLIFSAVFFGAYYLVTRRQAAAA